MKVALSLQPYPPVAKMTAVLLHTAQGFDEAAAANEDVSDAARIPCEDKKQAESIRPTATARTEAAE